jgi:4-diphosphocytidyl-2-C-methyl-D-erythritol kinase
VVSPDADAGDDTNVTRTGTDAPGGRPASGPVTLHAHAKLTTTLRVTGVREDGFHLIDAEMVSLDLHDVLTVDPQRRGLAATGPFADGLPLDDRNLVARALAAVDRTAHVTVDKQIPHGGGLGGGSADAASILAWAGHASDVAGLRAASQIGADVPFCLIGGRARVRGIGEIIDPLPHVDRSFTLVIPPLTASTPAVYAAWDELGGPTADGANDLEPAALVVEPRLRWWRDMLTERWDSSPVLAGSGATWFIDGERDDALDDLVDEGARIVVARTIPDRNRRPRRTGD